MSTKSRSGLWSWRSGLFHVRGPDIPRSLGLTVIAVAAGVVAASSAIAWNGDVPKWEASILEFINGWPDWFEPAMWFLQQPGVLFFPVAAGAVIAFTTRRWHYALPFVLLPAFKLIIEKGVVKPLVDRSRPSTSVGPQIQARGSAGLDEPSFPSGHTTTAIATALLIAAFLPAKWRPLPIIWGVVVAIARLYYGEHNFLDVTAGAALAVIFATSAWMLIISRWVGDGPVTT
ncbi:MAG: phosphatase PAP2 family protein [Actinomycetia bacterium]|nr:phosphatase PAP2 family protein [Actinomycetes bacterium]MCP4084630.1 phosphatase PAP2 family protein [Actinomycetes bacterium]